MENLKNGHANKILEGVPTGRNDRQESGHSYHLHLLKGLDKFGGRMQVDRKRRERRIADISKYLRGLQAQFRHAEENEKCGLEKLRLVLTY